MKTRLVRLSGIALLSLVALGAVPAAHAATVAYSISLAGGNEDPPNASAGIGTGQVDIDATAHTMRVQVSFSGLTGTVTASHIHGPTALAGSGNAGVATQTPTFVGFPSGVTAGAYDVTFDMTLAASYNAAFVTANGGTVAGAEAALFQAIADGKAYLNIHSSAFPGGEIRGFLQPAGTTPTDPSTWGRVKALYR